MPINTQDRSSLFFFQWKSGVICPLFSLLLVSICLLTGSCRKMVSIDEPINSITSAEVFSTDAQASSAMAGVYTLMINGSAAQSFGAGNFSVLMGLSADELNYYSIDINASLFNSNKLTANSYGCLSLWQSAYLAIYRANSVIEGISASTSSRLHDSVRTRLTGESKFVRALCYFYLTNLFGDVPLALTMDFNKTQNMPRTPQKQVYQQIVNDLQDAVTALPAAYLPLNGINANNRIRPNKWAAAALLARVDLFLGDYNGAASQASAVISQSGVYYLESDLNQVFLTGSREAIWQLQQNPGNSYSGTATPEGMLYVPNPLNTGLAYYTLTAQLLGAFEPGDGRLTAWVGSTNNSNSLPANTTYFPYKYKTGYYNRVIDPNTTPAEYCMVLRLAEQYLIRAEAEANGAAGGAAAAIADLNIVRARAGLPALSSSLTADQLIAAVAHEKQVELFGEWGHRWLDLKRTGKARDVLSQLSTKQPWAGDYQLLYPIPPSEILTDHNLVQNPGYLN